MLHIFRDSPFIHLDKRRIFLNYIEWINETIKILKKQIKIGILKFIPIQKNGVRIH